MRKQATQAAVATATAPEGQGPAPTNEAIVVVAFCRIPGTCYPVDDRNFLVTPPANANDLIAQIGHIFITYWIRQADPNFAAIREGFRQKWLSDTGQR